MMIYHYPKCSTCQKALKFLHEKEVSIDEKNIVTETPAYAELKNIIDSSGLPIQKFFNTSGIKYRELGLSTKLKEMSDEDKIKLLASDGMLIKRPLGFDGKKVTLGFKEDVYQATWIDAEKGS